MTVSSAESCFPFVSFGDPNEVVSRSEVDLTEPGCLLESVEGFLDKREWVSVFDRDFVEFSVVDTESKGIVGFLDKQDG